MIRTVQPVRNRHLVREIDRGRQRELLVVAGLVVLLLLPLLVYVWNHMEWIRIGYEMERLKKERVEQAQLGERLRIEKSTLESLSRVESLAKDRLGLVPATGAVVRLDGGPAAPVAVAGGTPGATAPAPPAGSRAEAVR